MFDKEYSTVLKSQIFYAGLLFVIGFILLILSDTLYSHTLLYAVALPIMYISTFWFLSRIQNLRQKCLHYSFTAFLSGTYSLVFLILITIPFFNLPEGTEIRPMGWSACLGIVSMLSIFSGFFFSILGITLAKNKRWLLNISALIYCLSVFWIVNLIFDYAVSIRELILEP